MCQSCCSHYYTHLLLHRMIVVFLSSLHLVSSLMPQVLILFFSITDGCHCWLLFLFLVFTQTILCPWIPSECQSTPASWHQLPPASRTWPYDFKNDGNVLHLLDTQLLSINPHQLLGANHHQPRTTWAVLWWKICVSRWEATINPWGMPLQCLPMPNMLIVVFPYKQLQN